MRFEDPAMSQASSHSSFQEGVLLKGQMKHNLGPDTMSCYNPNNTGASSKINFNVYGP